MKKFEPYEGKEDNFQASAMQYIRFTYPNVLAFHVPNGGKRNAREGAKFKRQGVLAGVPDILIVHPSRCETNEDNVIERLFYGFAVELKVKGGKLSQAQKDRLADFHLAGWKQKVVYSLDEFIFEIDNYLK